ncbi:MAG: integrase family protein [Betaproteobacteria bacterium]|jgi:integrase|nr:integrase family protein [Betaproteobacteria bacterium]
MPKQKLTKSFVQDLPLTDAGQQLYWDTELPGFGLRVGRKTKAFFAEAKVNRKTIRYTIGIFPRFMPEGARDDAKDILRGMEKGEDPRKQNLDVPALEDAYEAFKQARELAVRTRYDYDRYLRVYFPGWRTKAINEITPAMVAKRHLELQKRHGAAQANAGMRFLRSLLYYSQAEYGETVLPSNPVKTLGEKRQWFREMPRQNVVKMTELPAWFKAVLALKNDKMSQDRETVRDLLLTFLFLGVRRSEALTLRWENVDLNGKTVAFPKTKNYEGKTLPFGSYMASVLHTRFFAAAGSPFVFPSSINPRSHLIEPRKVLQEVNRTSGVTHTLHDLRRTFATFLESLDVSVYAARKLMGHKAGSGDVMSRHYVVTDVERLRPAIEKLEQFILSAGHVKPAAEVVPIKKATKK